MLDFKAKMHKIPLQRPQTPVAGLIGPTSKGRWKEREWGGKEEGGMPHLYKRGDKRPWPLVPVSGRWRSAVGKISMCTEIYSLSDQNFWVFGRRYYRPGPDPGGQRAVPVPPPLSPSETGHQTSDQYVQPAMGFPDCSFCFEFSQYLFFWAHLQLLLLR